MYSTSNNSVKNPSEFGQIKTKSVSATQDFPLRIKIVSDVHLGYLNSDTASFNKFLDALQSDSETTDLVLLGDIVDMWRRDASGIFLEYSEIFRKLIKLKEKMRVHYVAGNHDYHVLQLRGQTYPFDFRETLEFKDGKFTYIIKHGFEYDPIQKATVMEALCHVMFNPIGVFDGLFGITQPPEKRLAHILNDLEQRAYATIKKGEILVFGHTHHPFINNAGNFVNTGSWVLDSPIHNTIVELHAGKARLFTFEGPEITERAKF
ncbi:MAG: UDP-2,3-diacylglucosamine diphosphatase [Ignavibacteria bacterium]